MGRFRYWSTHRPVSIGTYPKDYSAIEIANFHTRKFVPEIHGDAWGFIDFENELPESEQDHYDLRPERRENPKLEQAARAMARALKKSDMSRIAKILERAYDKGLIEDDEELVREAQLYM